MTDPGMNDSLEACIGCGTILPVLPDAPMHRYLNSSAACWGIFNALHDPERPLEAAPLNALIVDAWAVQHPGAPSNQTVNSAAIHLMVLYGVLERDFNIDQAMWLRQRPGRPGSIERHSRFHWLTSPSFAGCLTVANVAAGETPHERSRIVEAWVRDVWKTWSEIHGDQVAAWFEKFVISERF